MLSCPLFYLILTTALEVRYYFPLSYGQEHWGSEETIDLPGIRELVVDMAKCQRQECRCQVQSSFLCTQLELLVRPTWFISRIRWNGKKSFSTVTIHNSKKKVSTMPKGSRILYFFLDTKIPGICVLGQPACFPLENISTDKNNLFCFEEIRKRRNGKVLGSILFRLNGIKYIIILFYEWTIWLKGLRVASWQGAKLSYHVSLINEWC